MTTDGTLGTAIGHVDTVPQPRTFGFLPDGTLLVLSERDAVGVRYRPTGQGRLEELETLDLEAGPNWISVVGPR